MNEKHVPSPNMHGELDAYGSDHGGPSITHFQVLLTRLHVLKLVLSIVVNCLNNKVTMGVPSFSSIDHHVNPLILPVLRRYLLLPWGPLWPYACSVLGKVH